MCDPTAVAQPLELQACAVVPISSSYLFFSVVNFILKNIFSFENFVHEYNVFLSSIPLLPPSSSSQSSKKSPSQFPLLFWIIYWAQLAAHVNMDVGITLEYGQPTSGHILKENEPPGVC